MIKINAATRLSAAQPSLPKQVAKAIKTKYGLDVELIQGRGYCYFADAGASNVVSGWHTGSSVMTNKIKNLSLESWVAEFDHFMKENA